MIKQKAWAFLLAGIIALGAGAIHTNAFATTEESTAGQEQMQATTNTELPGLSSDGTGNDQSNVSITNSNVTVTEEQPATSEEQPSSGPSAEEQQGSAIFTPEQVVDMNQITADCFAMLDDWFDQIWWNGVLINISGEDTTDTGDIAGAIENATENITDAVSDDLGQEGQDALNDIGGEISQNITNEAGDAGIDLSQNVSDAIQEAGNGSAIIDEEANDALIDQIKDDSGATGEISDIIGGAIGDVISGDLNASEAADQVAEDLTELGNSSDITVDDINSAAGEVNVTEISDGLQDAINTNDSSGEIADSIIDGATDDVAQEGGQDINSGTESGDRNVVARIDATISELQSIRTQIAGAL